ncbi:carbon-nitrogen family hydrolase [Peptoniphilus sp. MSJ-1]|uniref:Carbon-nitrogen family hydrolase n=1 Tax=Peptoniphilus ovalis TaxID=2841503 RepID=A0ABS6FGW8_9FIRM|nr:nitrilase-related carbon-nitrogen hydrolase [Peptoniphilus ovalis]MBU5669400.1 carbon-nitrogen family hydrolase [Peptoniphilus ovalis]
MKIAIIQDKFDPVNIDKNYKIAEEKILEAAKNRPDTIVLPELWNICEFDEELKEKVIGEGDRVNKFFSKLSKKLNVNIIGGSVANFYNGEVKNTSFIYNRSGELIASYDKTHLYIGSDEDKFTAQGCNFITFKIDNIKCSVAICFDISFPEMIRKLALQGIEILFIVAAWPEAGEENFKTYCKVRAIENQIFVVANNRLQKIPKIDSVVKVR